MRCSQINYVIKLSQNQPRSYRQISLKPVSSFCVLPLLPSPGDYFKQPNRPYPTIRLASRCWSPALSISSLYFLGYEQKLHRIMLLLNYHPRRRSHCRRRTTSSSIVPRDLFKLVINMFFEAIVAQRCHSAIARTGR
jgi:hypothetical protein